MINRKRGVIPRKRISASSGPFHSQARKGKTPTKFQESSGNVEEIRLEVFFSDIKSVPSEQNLREEAESMLDAGKKDLAETQMDDRFVYANQGGFVYFEKMDRLEIEIQKINAKLKESEEKHRESEKKHQESEQRHRASERQIRALTESSEGYQKVRSRFLSTYLRDILGAKPVEQHIISAGNRAAHDGDVIADASLYIKQDRTDTNTFVELYGITPALAAELDVSDDFKTIQLLNKRATIIANRKFDDSNSAFNNWNLAFNAFVTLLLQTNERPSDPPVSPISQAYSRFWAEYSNMQAQWN